MVSYEKGAFDALEWAWYMLRNYRDHPGGLEEAREAIKEALAEIGNGTNIDFRQRIIGGQLNF
jgi:hypothetical protein